MVDRMMGCVAAAPKSALALRRFFAVMLLVLGMQPAMAAEGMAQPVGDPLVEARVNKLAEELRCLTCMGQSIADSQSSFSSDMKREIRTMIVAGKSDKEIMEFMVQRYGDFVLYRPPVKNTTWLLWGGPFLFLILSLGFLMMKLRKRRGQNAAELTASEHQQAVELLGGREVGRP